MLRKTLLLGIPLFIILITVYYFLGGFNSINIQLAHTNNYVIAGKSYQGPFKEKLLKEYFLEMKNYVAQGQLNGTVIVVDHWLEHESADSIHQFIGVVMESSSPVPEAIQVDTLFAQQAVRAIVRAHPAVMPRPDKVIRKMRAYAKENNIALREYAIEQYVEDDEIWVDIPLAPDIY